jgi:hypothetical protein
MDQVQPKFEAVPRPEGGQETAEHAQSFETPKAPEKVVEISSPAVPAPTPAPAAPVKDEITHSVETILEKGLEETYTHLTPAAAAKFKKEGERITVEITGMIRKLHVNAGKVLALITGWLRIIPAVNRYFLVQEAKIKTDLVMALAEEEKRKRASGT